MHSYAFAVSMTAAFLPLAECKRVLYEYMCLYSGHSFSSTHYSQPAPFHRSIRHFIQTPTQHTTTTTLLFWLKKCVIVASISFYYLICLLFVSYNDNLPV